MGIQVAIRGDDEDSGTGKAKLHGPTRPKGKGHSDDPYLGFPHHAQPWRGSLADGLRAFSKWLETKPALQRRASSIRIYSIRTPADVRGKRLQRHAQKFLREG